MNVETVAVIGAGIMGRGIAHVAALAGFRTVLNDVSTELLEKAKQQVAEDLRKGVQIGKLDAPSMNSSLDRLSLENDLERAARTADIVIEAVPERIDLKLDVFSRLDKFCPPQTVLASNTSA